MGSEAKPPPFSGTKCRAQRGPERSEVVMGSETRPRPYHQEQNAARSAAPSGARSSWRAKRGPRPYHQEQNGPGLGFQDHCQGEPKANPC